jgi:U3 small nucleolar RNA-associated protein 23
MVRNCILCGRGGSSSWIARRMTCSRERKRAWKRVVQCQKLYGLQEPFQVLMDGTFLYQTITKKLVVKELIQSVFGKHQVQWLVTACIRNELKALGESHRGASLIAKRIQVLPCQHETLQEIDAAKCIESLLQQQKLFVATGDQKLIQACKKQYHIPVLFITSRGTLHLAKPE